MNLLRTENYKNHNINIYYDEDAACPFSEWDCEFPILTEAGRYEKHDYSDGDIDNFLCNYLSLNQITRNLSKILEFIGSDIDEFNSDYPLGEWTGEERAEVLKEQLGEFIGESIENKTDFCEVFNIKHYSGTSRGYSQGDWADVFVCWTPEFGKITGLEYKDVTEKMLESTFDLFGHWAWNDVFSYTVENQEGDVIDSCGGFYGDDFENNGLFEYAEGYIDAEIEEKRKNKQEKVKTLIKNHVPLEKRTQIIAQ